MESYIVVRNSVTGINNQENGNAINYQNRTLQSFSNYEEALALAKREQRNLLDRSKSNDPNYDSLYICRKTGSNTKAMRFLTATTDSAI